MSNANESVMREWRPERDEVYASLRPNRLELKETLYKLKKVLCEQETQFRTLILEILEHKRSALQLESEKMGESSKEARDLQEKLANSQKMFEK
eukprot:15728592-Heterocapsa_arctica.AAC.1